MFFNTVAPELQVGVAGMPKVIESNKLASDISKNQTWLNFAG